MTTRIVVTCSRSWSAWSTLRAALEKVHAEHPDAVLVHGDAPRGDRQAAGIWRHLGGEVEAWPAKWDEHGDDCKCPRSNPTCHSGLDHGDVAPVTGEPVRCTRRPIADEGHHQVQQGAP